MQTTQNEIVLSERVVTNEYRIIRIDELIVERKVEVTIEIGPFVEEYRNEFETIIAAKGGRRRITVWEGETYDAIRDTWRNEDLMAAIAELM